VDDINQAHLKLIDFGFSRRYEPGTPMKTKVITPFYVCPELLVGKGYGEGCDIWSLGVILFLMFSGEPPFTTLIDGPKGDQDLYKKIKKGDYEFNPYNWSKISKDAQNMVKQMLTVDPSKRPSAEELMKHNFLSTHITATNTALSDNAINSLRAFRQKDKLQKVTLQMVAKYVDDKKVEDLQKMFETMDDDGNGTLSLDEMKDGFMKNGMPELAAEIEKTMDDIDNDGSGLIDYSEFLAATMSRHVYLEYDYLWQVFKNFDASNTGKLSPNDLVQVLSGGKTKTYTKGSKDEACSEVTTIMEKYDTDNSGDLDFDEFMEMMKGSADTSDMACVTELKANTVQAMQSNDPGKRGSVRPDAPSPNQAPEGKADAVSAGDATIEIRENGPIAGSNLPEIDDKERKVGCCGFF
jgi:calcium-dependent protein kinase